MATGRIGTTPVLQVRWSKAPSDGTTSLSGLDDNSVSLVYSVGYEAVYRNGVLLSRTNDYTATDGTTVTLIDATITGDIIEIFANQTIPLSDTYSQTVSDGKFINNTLTTTTGDLIYASGANTPARLAIGTSADVLTVSGGIPAWAAPAAGLTWAAGGNGSLPAASSLQLSISAKESVIIRISGMSTTADAAFYLRINNSSASVYDYNGFSHTTNTTATTNYIKQINDSKFELNYPNGLNDANNEGTWYIRVDGCKNGGFVSMATTGLCKNVGDNNLAISFGGMFQASGAVTTLDLILSAGNFDAGTYEYWVA
jgi:hypothetical protein